MFCLGQVRTLLAGSDEANCSTRAILQHALLKWSPGCLVKCIFDQLHLQGWESVHFFARIETLVGSSSIGKVNALHWMIVNRPHLGPREGGNNLLAQGGLQSIQTFSGVQSCHKCCCLRKNPGLGGNCIKSLWWAVMLHTCFSK